MDEKKSNLAITYVKSIPTYRAINNNESVSVSILKIMDDIIDGNIKTDALLDRLASIVHFLKPYVTITKKGSIMSKLYGEYRQGKG
jgi:hypothetical protein